MVNLGKIVVNRWSTFPISPRLETQHQMQFSVIRSGGEDLYNMQQFYLAFFKPANRDYFVKVCSAVYTNFIIFAFKLFKFPTQKHITLKVNRF